MNVRSENTAQHSTWFRVTKTQQRTKTNCPKICSPFVTSSWPKTTDGERLPGIEIDASGSIKIPKTEAQVKKATKELGNRVRTVKVKLHPRSADGHALLQKTFGAARWTYNECVRIAADPACRSEREEMGMGWAKYLRARVLNRDSGAVSEHPWLTETAYDIRDDARKDFATATKGCWTKKKNGTLENFRMRFRSKKAARSESIYLRSRWIEQRANTIVVGLPGHEPLELWTGKRAWRGAIKMDCRLQRTCTNDYFLCIPQTFEPAAVEAENQGPTPDRSLRVCALDPGVRTFQTVFDANEGCALQVGDADMNRIFRLCRAQDSLISKQAAKGTKSKQRSKIKRAVRRLRERIRNLVDEVHKQLAKYLAQTYDLVMLPAFEVSQMVKRGERKIHSTTARKMATWAHYRFKQRVLFKCRQLGCGVAVVNEAYTSKTCSCCGAVKNDLGGAKVYRCANAACGAVIDRDVNGAKNIFLRNYEALEMTISGIGAYPLQSREGLLHGSSRLSKHRRSVLATLRTSRRVE